MNSEGVSACRTQDVSRPNFSRVMRTNFGDTMAEILREHSDSLDPDFLRQEEFSCGQNIIRDVGKSAVLKMLYQDNKISRAYLLKYSNPPASLYELSKYNLLDNLFGKDVIQAEKIDKLPLPRLIKEDLKLSFSRS